MKAYKGFNKDMTCRGFQYEVGKEYETDKAELCNCGFHAYLYPQDCFGYYPPANSRYCLVELDDVDKKSSDDTKICGKKIKIIKELTIEEMTTASVEYVLDRIKENKIGGDWSSLNGGKFSVVYGGENAKVKGGLHSVLALQLWNGYELKEIKVAIVDGKKIKADTWYKLENGEFVEVNENE